MRLPATGVLLIALCAPAAAAERYPDIPRVEGLVVEGINAFRREQGLGTLRVNRDLEATARDFAAFMARSGKFDHDADGSTPADRVRRHGYDYCIVAENIAREYSSRGFATAQLARELVEGWKNSPGHRKNILEAEALDTGVAIAHRTFKGNEDYYAVQVFGRPRSESVEFQVRNASRVSVRYRIGERSFTIAPRQLRRHTECAPRALDFEGTDPAHVAAAKGDKFVVVHRGGALAIERDPL